MGPGMPRRMGMDNDKLKEPLPKNIKEVPGYLKRVVLKLVKKGVNLINRRISNGREKEKLGNQR